MSLKKEVVLKVLVEKWEQLGRNVVEPQSDFPHAAAGKGFYSRWALTRWDLGVSPSFFGNGKHALSDEMGGWGEQIWERKYQIIPSWKCG